MLNQIPRARRLEFGRGREGNLRVMQSSSDGGYNSARGRRRNKAIRSFVGRRFGGEAEDGGRSATERNGGRCKVKGECDYDRGGGG